MGAKNYVLPGILVALLIFGAVIGWIEFVKAVSLIGLVLSIIGSIKLVSPFVQSNNMIEKISSQDIGLISDDDKKKINEHFKQNLQESREASFLGISYIFVGFSLQIVQYLPFVEKICYAIISVLVILFIDAFVMFKIKERKDRLEND